MAIVTVTSTSRRCRAPWWLGAMLWGLPNPARPGLLAFCVVIARATIGGLLVAAPAALIWGEETIQGGLPRLVTTLGWVLFEELARLNFCYRAERPVRAALLFLILIVSVETLFYPTGGYGFGLFLLGRAPSIAIHVLATVGLAFGLTRRRWLWPAVAAVLTLHVAFNFWAPDIVGALTGLDQPQP